jgi:two-component system nitrogen regulation response regulator GlnG/two-component system response regulator HydG
VIGEADGGTLLLDEIGELPHHLQAHLLRVLDHHGEYQRLGEGRTLRSRFRLVAATNRPVEALKHDLAARFSFRIEVPGLDQRREDVPLLLQHMLARAAREHPALAARFFEQRDGATAEARVDPRVIEALLRRRFTLHSRELERLMWVALSTSPGEFLSMTPELLAALGLQEDATERGAEARAGARYDHAERQRARDPDGIAREEIEAVLAATGGNVTEAAQRLGLRSRFVLHRLIKRYGIAAPEGAPDKG